MQITDFLDLAREVSQSETGKKIGRRKFAQGALAMMPALAAQLHENTLDPGKRESLYLALKEHENDDYESVAFIDNLDPKDSQVMIDHIFGGDIRFLADAVAETGFLPDKIYEIALLLMPLTIAYLARRQKEKGLTADDLVEETAQLQKDVADLSGPAKKLLQTNSRLLKGFFN